MVCINHCTLNHELRTPKEWGQYVPSALHHVACLSSHQDSLSLAEEITRMYAGRLWCTSRDGSMSSARWDTLMQASCAAEQTGHCCACRRPRELAGLPPQGRLHLLRGGRERAGLAQGVCCAERGMHPSFSAIHDQKTPVLSHSEQSTPYNDRLTNISY